MAFRGVSHASSSFDEVITIVSTAAGAMRKSSLPASPLKALKRHRTLSPHDTRSNSRVDWRLGEPGE